MPIYLFFLAKVAFLWQFAKCGHVFFGCNVPNVRSVNAYASCSRWSLWWNRLNF